VIRRAAWLAIGAALGAAGYRKVSRLGARGQAAGFLRDVRDGMADYQRRNIDRQARRSGNTLGSRETYHRTAELPGKEGR
jgi:hypothetical protein